MKAKELSCKDLMVGDWVRLKISQHNTKVTNIDADSIYTEAAFPIRYDEIESIPLTSEILEKNGFEKTQIQGEKQDDIFQCLVGEIIIEVGIYDPNFILIRYRYETPDGIESGELSSIVKVDGGKFYLHDLQHTLRLCGITREIIL